MKRDVPLPTLGFKVNGDVTRPHSPPPQLGEHTQAVLTELGMTEDEIQALRHMGVIAARMS